MNHRIGKTVFSLAVGILVASVSYRWITNPELRETRANEEQVVRVSRSLLTAFIAGEELTIVDPLEPDRKVGKVYVYAEGPGWAVSGFYRRGDQDEWHPYLMALTPDLQLVRLKVKDVALTDRAADDPRLEVTP